MTLLCCPCYVDELERAARHEPPRMIPPAVIVADGKSLCGFHAPAWAHAVTVEDDPGPIATEPA